MMEKYDSDNQEIQKKLDTLKKFQTSAKIPNRLYYRIRRHLENNQIQIKFQDSEKLLNELPLKLRDLLVAKTHGSVFKKIKFFRDKLQDQPEFNTAIVHELKPINLSKNELLYQ